jgi:hypothetical protein
LTADSVGKGGTLGFVGSMFIVKAASLQEARNLMEQDVYYKENVVCSRCCSMRCQCRVISTMFSIVGQGEHAYHAFPSCNNSAMIARKD